MSGLTLTMALWDHLALTLSPYNAPLACTPAQGGTAGSCFLSPQPHLSPGQDPQYRLEMLDWTVHLAQGSVPAEQSTSPGEGSRADI